MKWPVITFDITSIQAYDKIKQTSTSEISDNTIFSGWQPLENGKIKAKRIKEKKR
jgi:hypothetical protein